jgi:hypothetical protein
VELISSSFLPNPFRVTFMIRFKRLRHCQLRNMNHKSANMSHNIFTDIKRLKMSLSKPSQAGEGVEV